MTSVGPTHTEPSLEGWDGAWVSTALGVSLTAEPSCSPERLRHLVGLAVRRNPRRAHLLVSHVLGKHVPVDPSTVYDAASELGTRVAELLRRTGSVADLVLGYAETATALGHVVADTLGSAAYLSSTRRHVSGVEPAAGFEEEHSHATGHLLLPASPSLLLGTGALVLVDDELSTGRTALNTIAALHRASCRKHYVVATLLDLRGPADRAEFARAEADLRTRIDVVSLAAGLVALPADVLERGQAVVAAVERTLPSPVLPTQRRHVRRVTLPWPADLPESGRHGFLPRHRVQLHESLPLLAAALDEAVGQTAGNILVLGTEEFMYVPLMLARELAQLRADDAAARAVRFSTTTRSPVLALDDDGYAIRSRIAFAAHDHPHDGPGERYAYNLVPRRGERPWGTVVVVVDAPADTRDLRGSDGLLARLAPLCDEVLLVTVPVLDPSSHGFRTPCTVDAPLPQPLRGPTFGSYDESEVAWLLTDLSDAALEAPVEEREEAIQAGGAHYAESLPIEFQPDEAYQALYARALADGSRRIAVATGVLGELLLSERGPDLVLASLARAGTPVGVLLRRWLLARHGLTVPHYAVSIVRGRGIDTVALRYLARHHDPAAVAFVDGWTGKGAIARELTDALRQHADRCGAVFSDDLAVLADPGSCVRLYGTRDDFLVPSACLNSTVSGLVSRTVLNARLLRDDQFHGAKFYADLAPADVSRQFVDTVSALFSEVASEVAELLAERDATGPAASVPTWSGWAAVERISAEYGIDDVTLVKPGVGETTRVLLRRVPWRVLLRDGVSLPHVELLAEQRGVPVEHVRDLPYSAVGLIHPRFTRGATGADGTAAVRA